MVGLALTPGSVFAQRAGENIVASAEDAFGTAVGSETIGIYTSSEARGFSPKEAGNFRIDGLYFDQVDLFGYPNQLVRSTSIRVGPSAQSYPFAAPTGIVDIRLRLPGKKVLKGIKGEFGPYDHHTGQVDLEVPRDGKRPGVYLSFEGGQRSLSYDAPFYDTNVSGLIHWTPSETTEVIAFWYHGDFWGGENFAAVFTPNGAPPPKITRTPFFGPTYNSRRGRVRDTSGIIFRSAISDNWHVDTGVFRSAANLENDYTALYFNTQPNGVGDLFVRARPTSEHTIYSGEVRLAGRFVDGDRRHTVYLSARGRAGDRTFGGDDTLSYGPSLIGTLPELPQPTFNFGPQSKDVIRHGGLGVSYVGQWADVGEISAGVQKAFYRRALDHPPQPGTTTRATPWLYNGTLSVQAGTNLTFYAGYSRGLENSPIAPENAINPGEAPAASLTKQVDAGLRLKFARSMTLVAGVFDVKKPYFDRDASGFFTQAGRLSHRGIELSLSGSPLADLKIIAGAVLLKPRISGAAVDQGLIAKVPLGRPATLVEVNATYGPEAWHGVSVSGRVQYKGAHYANRLNTARLPSLTTLDLGIRYDFNIRGAALSARLDVKNVTNTYDWTVDPIAGSFRPSISRQHILRLAADF